MTPTIAHGRRAEWHATRKRAGHPLPGIPACGGELIDEALARDLRMAAMRYDARPRRPPRRPWTSPSSWTRCPELKAYKDSSIAMMRALERRGHRVFALGQADIFWEGGVTRGAARALTLSDDDHDWYRAGEPEIAPAARLRRGDHAQGPAVRHGVRVLDVPARMRRARRRARLQPAAGDPRQQREDGDHEVRRVHRADARHARCGADRRVHRRASRT